MSTKWSWVFGILTAAAFLFGLVFFAVTQELAGRDWAVLGIGILLGATTTALIATFIFHADVRARKLASEASEVRLAADSESARLDSESRARIESEKLSAVAEKDRLDKLASADAALLEKRAALLKALPTRSERLNEIEDRVAELRISITDADGRYKSGMAQAQDAANHGYNDMAYESQSAAETWKIAGGRFVDQLKTAEVERDRLLTMSDEEYRDEQVNLRGLV